MDAACINANRCTGFHTSRCNSVSGDGFRQMIGCRFCTPSSGKHFTADMHQSVQECTCSQNYAFGMERNAPAGNHSRYFSVLDQKFFNSVLPDMKVRYVLQNLSPGPDKFTAVALCTWTPHGRTFRAVEHAELNGSTVCYQSHVTAQCIDLPYDLSFGNASYGRVATHLANLVHVHCDETCFRAKISGCSCSLTTCVSGSYYNNVVIEIHTVSSFIVVCKVTKN